MDSYSNALGYGIFCGKKCAAEKAAQGIPPKNGKKNKERWAAEQAQKAQEQANSNSSGTSKAPIIIVSLLGVALIVGVIVIIKRRKK